MTDQSIKARDLGRVFGCDVRTAIERTSVPNALMAHEFIEYKGLTDEFNEYAKANNVKKGAGDDRQIPTQ